MRSPGARLHAIARRGLRSAVDAATWLRPDAADIPAWERSVLDDVAARRPWNLRVKAARRRALTRVSGLTDGVTVVIVNWNTKDVTADVIRAVQRLSPPETRILVVDNGSTDGSQEMLRGWVGIQTMLLRSNAGHGLALDLAVCAARTTVVVTLDSDAIPLTSDWLDQAVDPVRQGRAVLAGLRSSRGFVHPVYSAVNTREFLRRRLSFQTHVPKHTMGTDITWGVDAFDTSELLTRRIPAQEIVFVERTENEVPGLPGMTTGGVVYHHGGVSRGTAGSVLPEALDGWRSACAQLADAVRTAPSSASAYPSAPGVSVVIPVLNAAATLGSQLEALAAADRPAAGFEVIIADNGSSDATREVALSFADRLPLRVIDAGVRRSSNYARNAGVAVARASSILLCDGDDEVDAAWLATMSRALDAGHELVAGPIDYTRLNEPAHWAWRGAPRASVMTVLNFLPIAHGANLGFTKELHERLGGFDEEFGFGGEDVEFCWRAQLAGARLQEVHDAVVHYRLRPSLKTLYRQSRAYGAAEAHLFAKFGDRGLKRRSPRALARDIWWLVSRAPFAITKSRRGAWMRKMGTQHGRFQGARKYRVLWW